MQNIVLKPWNLLDKDKRSKYFSFAGLNTCIDLRFVIEQVGHLFLNGAKTICVLLSKLIWMP